MFHLLAQSTDAAGDAAAAAIVGGMFMVYFIVGIVAYVVSALALMTIAKKLGKTEKSWWAWIPILNLLLLAELAGHEAWMGLICLVPVVGGFFGLYLFYKVCEARNKPGWMALLMLIPCVGFFVPLYVAYAD